MTAAGFGWGLPVNIWDLETFQTRKGRNDCTFNVYRWSLALPSQPHFTQHCRITALWSWLSHMLYDWVSGVTSST